MDNCQKLLENLQCFKEIVRIKYQEFIGITFHFYLLFKPASSTRRQLKRFLYYEKNILSENLSFCHFYLIFKWVPNICQTPLLSFFFRRSRFNSRIFHLLC